MKTKLSKHPKYDDPSAFAKARNFAKITVSSQDAHPMAVVYPTTQFFKMGKLSIILDTPSKERNGYFLSVHGKDSYPTWDEIVWIRYSLIPDAARMAMILPNLNSYINQEDTRYKFVFTMEQNGWMLDPVPTCEKCGKPLHTRAEWNEGEIKFFHSDCDTLLHVNPNTWNESHGNGFLAKRD